METPVGMKESRRKWVCKWVSEEENIVLSNNIDSSYEIVPQSEQYFSFMS